MNLNEELKRIKQVMGLNESKTMRDILVPANPKSPLHHYSTYKNRESIKQQGLLPKIGRQTLNYLSHNESEYEPIPMIFAQDSRHGNYFGVYGSDLWEINLDVSNVNWYKDPIHKDDGNNWDFYVTTDPIPPEALKLISSDEQRDDDIETYRQTGVYPNRNPIEEPEKPKEVNPWEDMVSKFSDDELSNMYINLDDLKSNN